MRPITRFAGWTGINRHALVALVLLVPAMLLSVACGRAADEDSAPPIDDMPSSQGTGLVAPEERMGGADGEADAGKAMAGAASVPAAAPAPGGPNLPAVDVLGRTIIRSGSINLEVESVADSFERVRQVAEASGGFVANSEFSGSDDYQRASMTVRVPADRFGAVVEQLRGLGTKVLSISTSGQDVTEEFADLEASLRNLRAIEARYLELLGRANTISDILQMQDRLDSVRLQVERTQGRIQLLDNLASLATLQVSLSPIPVAVEPVVEAPSGLAATARDAWEASLDTLTAVATVAVAVVVFSWWLVPLAIPAYFVMRRLLRTRALTARVDTHGGAA